jgi:hypothetical protein
VYRLRVFFVMTVLQMVFQSTTRSGLVGQGHNGKTPSGLSTYIGKQKLLRQIAESAYDDLLFI